MSGLVPPKQPRKRSSTDAIREDSMMRKRVEITRPEGLSAKMEGGQVAETSNTAAPNEREYKGKVNREDDSIKLVIDEGDEDNQDLPSLEDMMKQLKLNKRSGLEDIEKKIRQRRR